MEDFGVSSKRQVPVGDKRLRHRQRHRRQQHHGHPGSDHRNHTQILRRVLPDPDQTRVTKGAKHSRLRDDSESGHDHRQPGEVQRTVAQPRGLPAGQHPARRIRGIGNGERVRQQHGSQLRHLCRGDRVELESGVPPGLLAGADLEHRQPEQSVQQSSVGGHRPNPVAGHRQHVALQHAGAQLDVVGADAVGRGEPAGQSVGDDERDAADRPHRVPRRGPEHEGADQNRDLAQHLMDRMHEQHARAQPGPLRVHVASSAPSAAMSVSRVTT